MWIFKHVFTVQHRVKPVFVLTDKLQGTDGPQLRSDRSSRTNSELLLQFQSGQKHIGE